MKHNTKLFCKIFFLLPLLACCLLNSAPAATFVVTTTNPTGPGSLTQAMTDANSNSGPDVINFLIPGTGPHVIASGTVVLLSEVTIDGTTQPGYAGTPLIELDQPGMNGLLINNGNADNSVVRGIAFRGNPASVSTVTTHYGAIVHDENITIEDCIFAVFGGGININGATDFKVTGTTFEDIGLNAVGFNQFVFQVTNNISNTIPGGFLFTNNTIVNPHKRGFFFQNCSFPILVSDGSLPGTNIAIASLGNIPLERTFILNTPDITFQNVDFTGSSGLGVWARGPAGVTVTNCHFENINVGIDLEINGSNSPAVTVSNSCFINNTQGVRFRNSNINGGLSALNNCTFSGNGTGIQASGIGPMDATNNFWGDVSGPSNLGGSGDSYSGSVNAAPFLTSDPGCGISQPTTPVPTVSQWGLIIFGLTVLCLGAIAISNRRNLAQV